MKKFANLTEKLNDLSKLNFVECENKTLVSDKGITVRIDVKFSDRFLPIQLLLVVGFKGSAISHWGCEGTEQNEELAIWYSAMKTKVAKEHFKQVEQNEKDGLKLLNW
jgi:hypothetical protein